MIQERDSDREGLTGGDPGESVGPARPIRSADSPAERPSPPGTDPGESVGPARPIDPGRRRPGVQEDPSPTGERPAPAEGGPSREDRGSPQPPRQAPTRHGARRARTASARGALDRVRRTDFPVVLRGYDRATVDAYVADVAQLVAELEATQLPESVVQRALDEVGEETSAILKRAHEAGEEIAQRSRSQAEGRLQRAEHEAELTRKEAEERVRRLEDDIRGIWQERQRLIEDIRTLADDVLALADDAIERMPSPGGDREAEPAPELGGGESAAAGERPSGETRPSPDPFDTPGATGEVTGAAVEDADNPVEDAGAALEDDDNPVEDAGAALEDDVATGEQAADTVEDEDRAGEQRSDDAALTLERRPDDEDTAERPPRP